MDPDQGIHASRLMDPDSDLDADPAFFIIHLQDANKLIFFKSFSAYYLLIEGPFTSFFNDKK